MGKRWRTEPTIRGVVFSVDQRLIELKFRNGFRIGGVEPAALLELEDALGAGAERQTVEGVGWGDRGR